MKKTLFLAGAALAATLSAPANAGVLFQFDAANSYVNITSNQTICVFGSCSLSASLATPFDDFELEVGDTGTFDFAKFFVSGGFGGGEATIDAQLAFINPDADPATTGGEASYIRLGGIFKPGATVGSLFWDIDEQQLIGGNGEVFTVKFGELHGVTLGGGATSQVSITLDAIPEPATWAMMIGGFGLVGGAMRRRANRVVYA